MQRLLSDNNSYRLVQVTDTHLYADTSHVLVGMNCDEGLRDVIDLIRKKEDVIAGVLLTGDASQDNSAASYLRQVAGGDAGQQCGGCSTWHVEKGRARFP